MLGSEILEVVIGMIFVFLVLSLVCSAANEIIEAWLNKRADYLERGIKELLSDKDGDGLVAELYNHPLVAGLFRGRYSEAPQGWRKWLYAILRELGYKQTSLPSYIPAQNFALALLEITSPPSAVTSPPLASPDVITSPSSATKPDSKTETRRALDALIRAADGDPAKIRLNIENWYNSSMDRVAGWYKRRTQVIILFLGLIITCVFNVDTIVISNNLSSDKSLRSSLVSSAQEYAKADASKFSPAATPSPSPSASPSASTASPSASTSRETPASCKADANSAKCRLDTEVGRLENLGLPIGWDKEKEKLFPVLENKRAWLLKLLGLLITAFAISLGAPFWFDLLNKFMVVRSTVKPKEKSPDEPSKA